jgi:CheY-like chemotaxis protein
MAKILLVEDDNNLREIYEARLQAEGYDIVSARDGEEALTVAMKEKPDLVISDVMMPKISGFDMLDILRTTEETKNVKIIMMTALSQAEDKERAEKLGADRYLVKSQVTLEDVAKVAKEVLEGKPEEKSAAPAATVASEAPAEAPTPAAAKEVLSGSSTSEEALVKEEEVIAKQIEGMMGSSATPAAAPVAPAPEPAATTPVQPAPSTTTAPEPASTSTPPTTPDSSPVAAPADSTTPSAIPPQVPAEPAAATVTPADNQSTSTMPAKKVIEPINDLKADMKPKLEELAAKEAIKEEVSGVATNTIQQPGSTTPAGSAAAANSNADPSAPIAPPSPDTKIDPNSIAL